MRRRLRPPRAGCALVCACSLLSLTLAASAHAQEAQPPARAPEPARKPEPDADPRQIVVIGNRAIIASLKDIGVERTYDEDDVSSYDVSTVGEALEEIRSENGDEAPAILVNGQPVKDIGDVSDLPAEAIQRIEALPRGAASRIGGAGGQRAYNIVLRPSVKSATLTASREEAAEGGWGMSRGEALLTYVKQQDRLNLTLRGSDSGFLLESERDLVPRAESFPFSPIGNVIPFAGSEVDPLLSGRAGQPVTVVALPGTAQPTLADLVTGANLTNPSMLARYRSLRSAARPIEAAIAGNKALNDRWQLSFNSRLGRTTTESLRGLPTGRFLVPADNPFTVFSTPVLLALNDANRPLTSVSTIVSKSASATLNGSLGAWHAAFVGRYDKRDSRFTSDLNGSFVGGFFTVDAATNPFAGTLASSIPVTSRRATGHNTSSQISVDADGPLFQLPAGPLLARIGGGALWTRFRADDVSGSRAFDRRELTVRGGLTIPLTGERFLGALGRSELAVDAGRLDIGRFGTIDRYSVGLNWDPLPWLHVAASEEKNGTAIFPELLAAPLVITENVPYFDPLRNETVDVRLIAGGAANLANQRQRTRTVSLTASVLPKYSLRLTSEYQESKLADLVGALPPLSTAVVLAFPDRFVRDASGRLVQVDTTSVNFAGQTTRQLRLGVNVTVPIAAARSAKSAARRIPATKLQVTVNHTHLLNSTTLIRQGLPVVDLLSGGAIGIGGGQQRDSTTGSVALTRGGTGFRLNAVYRGRSFLQTGSLAEPHRLTFGSLLKLDARAFADLGQLFPRERLAKGTRLSLIVENVAKRRQRVTNAMGAVPQAYQPAYRDPIGRTVAFEFRKVI